MVVLSSVLFPISEGIGMPDPSAVGCRFAELPAGESSTLASSVPPETELGFKRLLYSCLRSRSGRLHQLSFNFSGRLKQNLSFVINPSPMEIRIPIRWKGTMPNYVIIWLGWDASHAVFRTAHMLYVMPCVCFSSPSTPGNSTNSGIPIILPTSFNSLPLEFSHSLGRQLYFTCVVKTV